MTYCASRNRPPCAYLRIDYPYEYAICIKNIISPGDWMSPEYGLAKDKNKNNDCPDYEPEGILSH